MTIINIYHHSSAVRALMITVLYSTSAFSPRRSQVHPTSALRLIFRVKSKPVSRKCKKQPVYKTTSTKCPSVKSKPASRICNRAKSN